MENLKQGWHTISLEGGRRQLCACKVDDTLHDGEWLYREYKKGEIPRFSQCLEHATILSHLIQEAKRNKGNRCQQLPG